MWNKNLERAKNYVRDGELDKARIILESMPDNEDAQDLLKKLRRHQMRYSRKSKQAQAMQSQMFQPQQNVTINQTIQQNNNRGCFGDIPSVPMALILINMALWACIMSFIVSVAAGSEYFVIALCGITVWFAFAIVMQYLLWKFFWWMLALSWTLSTIILILIAAAISSNPTMLAR